MAKDYNIKWTRSDYGKLSQAISQFNKNIKKLEALESELILPDVVNYKELKAGITTRKELNRLIRSLRRFSNPSKQKPVKLESGIEITRWEYTELKAERRRAERRLSGELSGIEGTMGTGNKRINEIRGTIASLQKLETATGNEFKRIRTRIKEQGTSDYDFKKSKIFQNNFIKAFKGMGRKEIVEIAQKFKNPTEFWNFIKDSGFTELQEFYDEAEGILNFSMNSDDRYYYELQKLELIE